MATLFVEKERHQAQMFYEDLGHGQRLELIGIPGGHFLMGSPDEEEQREDREGPQHKVTVDPFVMGRYLVTQAQWRIVAGFDPVNPKIEMEPNPSHFSDKEDSDKRPVESISWHQAVEFCDRLSNLPNATIAFLARLNGNMPVELEPQPLSTVEKPLQPTSPTTMAITPMAEGQKGSIGKKRLQ